MTLRRKFAKGSLHMIQNRLKTIFQQSAHLYRRLSQYCFLIATLIMGTQFYLFVRQLERGVVPSISRPPGIEAFLPISSLVSLKYWLVSGIFNTIHPSGLIIFITILSTTFFMKRGFCSWVCPFGLLSELLERIHYRIFRRKTILSKKIDYPLRSLKYLILLFFVWAIWVKMDTLGLEAFIFSPYNRIADIKMLKFFSDISATTLIITALLIGLTISIRHFWCRYLCPYGALLGGLSMLSLAKIRRNPDRCTHCRRCTKTCMANILIHERRTVYSDECHACLQCVDSCPEEQTLQLRFPLRQWVVKPFAYLVIVALLFTTGPVLGRIVGLWHNSITSEEYIYHLYHQDRPLYDHQRGEVPEYDRQALANEINRFRESPNIRRGPTLNRSHE